MNVCFKGALLFCRLQEERQRVLEEVLSDLKEVLQEGVERRRSGEEQKLSSVSGTIRSRVWEICRESLRQTLNQAKQEWKKVRVCFLRPIKNLLSLQ